MATEAMLISRSGSIRILAVPDPAPPTIVIPVRVALPLGPAAPEVIHRYVAPQITYQRVPDGYQRHGDFLLYEERR